MISLTDILTIFWPFSSVSRAETIRSEWLNLSRSNAEAVNCSRTNSEAIGFGGAFYMQLENGEVFRTAPLKAGTKGPRILMRFATDPEESGDERGVPITQADVDSVTLTAYTCTPNATTGYRNYVALDDYNGISVTASSFIFDTLQPWIDDTIGYNASYTVPADMFADATDGDYGKLKFDVELASNGEVLTQVIEGRLLF